jgi:predicted nucleic acid-binding protein
MDSCCFIELALQSIGKHETNRENDLWFLKELLNAAYDEKIEVLTSTLTIAECAHAKGDVSEDVKTLFKKFLTSGRYVFLVQDSVLVAEKARNLRWVHSLAFSGVDAIHIASALEMKCDEFITWDNKPHDNAKELSNLALTVCLPADTHCLPDEYLQQPLITAATPPLPPVAVPEQSTESENQPTSNTPLLEGSEES